MTDLDRIRDDLKQVRAYTPGEPVRSDLLLQVINDLAVALGVDSAHVLESLEALGDDSAESVLGELFKTLAPYQSGDVTRPSPIEYVAVNFPDNTIDMTRRDQIQEFAIAECGWPMGTYATIAGQRFELNYQVRDQRAYVLHQPGGIFLIPRYGEALKRHIEARDNHNEGSFARTFKLPGFNGRCVYKPIPPRYGKTMLAASAAAAISKASAGVVKAARTHVIVCDDPIDETKLQAQHAADTIRRFQKKIRALQRAIEEETTGMAKSIGLDFAISVEDDLLAVPDGPTKPVVAGNGPDYPRCPEERCRGPPGLAKQQMKND